MQHLSMSTIALVFQASLLLLLLLLRADPAGALPSIRLSELRAAAAGRDSGALDALRDSGGRFGAFVVTGLDSVREEEEEEGGGPSSSSSYSEALGTFRSTLGDCFRRRRPDLPEIRSTFSLGQLIPYPSLPII